MRNSYLSLATLLFAVIFLFPINFLKGSGESFSPYYFVLGVAIFLFGLVGVLSSKVGITELDKWLLVVMFGFALSGFSSINLPRTILYLMAYFLRGLLVAFIGERIAKSKSIVYNITGVIGLVALVGVIEFFVGWNPLLKTLPEMQKFFREAFRPGIAGSVGHPVPLAVLLTMFFPLAWYFFDSKKDFLSFFLLIVIGGAIIFCFSRASLITGLLAMGLYFWQTSRTGFPLVIACLLIGIFVVAIILVLLFKNVPYKENIVSRFRPISFYQEVFYSHRATSYRIVGNIFKEHPFGIGLGNYPLVHKKYCVPGANPDLATPDNMYLRLLAETGIIGLGIFMVFLIYWLKRFWQYRDNHFVLALFCSLLTFAINMIIGDFFHWYQLQIAFWFLFGITAGLVENGTQKENNF